MESFFARSKPEIRNSVSGRMLIGAGNVPGHAGAVVASHHPHAANSSASRLKAFTKNGEVHVLSSENEIIEERLFFSLLGEDGNEIPKDKRIEIMPWLSDRIVPVVAIGKPATTIWLLVNKEYAESDELDDIARAVLAKGYHLHVDFQVIVMAETLLLAISRGNLGGKRMQKRREVESNQEKASLFKGFTDIITWAHEEGAADVDFRYHRREDRSKVGFSIGGKWVYPERYNLPSQMMVQMLGLAFQFGEGMSEASLDQNIEQQLRIYLDLPKLNIKVMLRWASMAGDDVVAVTCRIIELNRKLETVSLDVLGYLESQKEMFNRVLNSDGGAVILSGVVNSGKSTTIATLMSMVPSTRKIVTIEDPVEFMIPGAIANTVARPLTGEESTMLASKLRTLKRTGFNDLLLGEIRDRETGAAAQDVFESGQKLYTTVHTGRAWMIPDRLAGQSIGIPREVLATPGNLRLLVNQSLIPKNCNHCHRPFTSLLNGSDSLENKRWYDYAERLKRLYDIDINRVRIRNPDGCEHCRRGDLKELYGFNGRTSASEMLEPDEAFCRLVAKGDNVGMLYYLDALRGDTRWDDPNMRGKSSMDCAVYKMAMGMIDPREIEPRYADFKTVEINRERFNRNPKAREETMGALA